MNTLRLLLSSKKFVAMIGGILLYAGGRFGFDLTQADADRILGIVALYLGVQGATDVGKEAAKERARLETVDVDRLAELLAKRFNLTAALAPPPATTGGAP